MIGPRAFKEFNARLLLWMIWEVRVEVEVEELRKIFVVIIGMAIGCDGVFSLVLVLKSVKDLSNIGPNFSRSHRMKFDSARYYKRISGISSCSIEADPGVGRIRPSISRKLIRRSLSASGRPA
ncbi:hypothetical protein SCHPADRAFT_892527 [Schizopora paradoxa]|uniref:Uncharacterized protein n=1 Tax=Schizopora paradoxa TaxID=27342 RepID=A0A0H2RF37_9AGAM|nr:hypothetical protein SCHPADRAFT_892527 [Schizopora paradoxa]